MFTMDSRTREALRIIIAVALGLVPHRVRRVYAERNVSISDGGKAEITARIVAAVESGFEVREKTDAETSSTYRGGTTRQG